MWGKKTSSDTAKKNGPVRKKTPNRGGAEQKLPPRARRWTICEMAMDGEDDRNKVFVNINVVLLCCGV